MLARLWPGDSSKNSGDYAIKVRNYLDQIIIKQLLKIHANIHADVSPEREAAYCQTIPFSAFLTTLKDDLNHRQLGDDYYFYVLLNDLHRYYQGYCIENDDSLNQDERVKLSWCMLQIEQFEKDIDRMTDFIRSVVPHRCRSNSFRVLSDYKDNTFTKNEIQLGFLRILKQLKQPQLNTKCFFQWRTDSQSFTPTAIIDGPTLAPDVCRSIVENAKTKPAVLFEGNNLITTDIDVDSIAAGAPEIIRQVDPDNIMKWKKVRLVALAHAETVINA
jgi:hypothetical protein